MSFNARIEFLPGHSGPTSVARLLAAVSRLSRDLLVTRYCSWLQQWEDAQRFREIDPRLARDVDLTPGVDRCPEGHAVDSRPLWGIGLTPRLDGLPSRGQL